MEKTALQKNAQKNGCAWKPNQIIMSPVSCNDVITYRLFMQLFKEPLRNRENNRTITISLGDIIEGDLIGSKYQRIHKALNNITNMKITFKENGEKSYKIYNIFSNAGFVKEKRGVRNDKVEVTVNSDFVPFLKLLNIAGFTKLPYQAINQLKRVPTIRLFELIVWRSQFSNEFEIKIETIRFYLNFSSGEHEKWGSLDQKVLAPAHKDINSCRLIEYDYSPIKNGRNVKGIFISVAKINIDKSNFDPVAISIVNEHVWENHREHILSNYSPEHIKYYHDKCHKNATTVDIADIDSYIFKSIVNDKDNFIEKKIAEQKIQKNNAAKLMAEKEKEKRDEKEFSFAKDCFYTMDNNEQLRYKLNIKYGSNEIKIAAAIRLFMIDYKNEIMRCKCVDDFKNILQKKSTS